ncbi:DUF1573 domain-containing protein [Rhodopirellula sp. P2]|uniref:DUF1573 domain-containing protein n=1 Tax=Rhodopirellula sp. P2 TaxID=2127060 RepID=UPI0023688CE7|nr:DUF1573 domain-containing protein [Rhodopirellula sp. P2]WDQ17874.1 DUF1573 domain-containing protein [Rhodopirellula sp. P2]
MTETNFQYLSPIQRVFRRSHLALVSIAVMILLGLGVFVWADRSPEVPYVMPALENIGELDQLVQIERRFTLHNPTDEDLTISDVRTSCTCTVPDLDIPLVLPPGETLEIPVTFDSKRASGKRTNAVALVLRKPRHNLDDPVRQMVVQYAMSAFIRPEVWVDASPIELAEIAIDQPQLREFRLRSRHDDYRIGRVRPSVGPAA